MATPPDFTAGQVLTAAQMNAVGLWKIGGATFTTVAGFNLPDGSFTADYENYRLIVNVSAVAVDADFTGRMRAAGTNATGTDYQNMFVGFTNGAVGDNLGNSGQTAFGLGESDNVNVPYRLVMDIMSPFSAVVTNIFATYYYTDKAFTKRSVRVGGGVHLVTTSYDSFAFISTQNITGEYWLYGYRD